jgi:hypothetical protein
MAFPSWSLGTRRKRKRKTRRRKRSKRRRKKGIEDWNQSVFHPLAEP